MTIKETHDYLKRNKAVNRELRSLMRQREQAETQMKITGISLYEILDDLDKRIDRLRMKKADLIIEMGAKLDQLSDDREALVLTAYFIADMTMMKISKGMGYSLQHTYRLKKSAVQHLADILSASQYPGC